MSKAVESDVNFRFLSGNQQPDFRTLSDFRKRFLSSFQTLFVKILELCMEVGLAKVGRVALDRTKIKANAALKQKRLEEQAEEEKNTQQEKIESRAKEERETGKKKRGRKPRTPQEAVNRERKANMTDPKIFSLRKVFLKT